MTSRPHISVANNCKGQLWQLPWHCSLSLLHPRPRLKKLPPSRTCLLCSQQWEKRKRAVRKSRSPIRHLPGCSGQSKSHDQAQCRWIRDASSCHKKAGPPVVMGRMYDSLQKGGMSCWEWRYNLPRSSR